MDERERRLIRQASVGGVSDILALAALWMRLGRTGEVRVLLQPHARKYPEARGLLVAALAENTAAFCGHCGRPLILNAEGVPITEVGEKPRAVPRKKICDACMYDGQYPNRNGRLYARRGLKVRYCGRCSVVKRSEAHRCDGNLPDWISGGDMPAKNTGPHWSDWRSL